MVVAWNVRDLLVDCLRSVFDDLARTSVRGEVWVVDNASTDGTVEALRAAFPPGGAPTLRVIEAGENLGFAAGNNLVLRALGFEEGDPDTRPDTVLLLNPDTVVQPGALQALLDGMAATGAGLAGAGLVYGDGSFQHSAFDVPGLMQLIIELFPLLGRLYESRLNGRYPRALYEQGQAFEVGHPLGATFLLRREAIEQTGLFDEGFELYCEEIDWAMRIRSAGWRVVCVPSAQVVHYGGQSTSQRRAESALKLWTARLRLYRKHYSPPKAWLAAWIIRAGMRSLIGKAARDSSMDAAKQKALVDAYREVIRRSRRA